MKMPALATDCKRLLVIAVMVMISSWGGIAFADQQNMKANPFGGGPCATDVKKFCKDVKPGEGRIMQCMQEHSNELSAECKADMNQKKEQHHGEAHQKQEACKGDVEKFCKDVQPGGGRIMQCLKQHSSELSPICKNTFNK